MEHLIPKMVVEKLLMELDEEMTKLELAIQKRVTETICQSEEELYKNMEGAAQHAMEASRFFNEEGIREDTNSRVQPRYRLSY
ncbi:hypothetical protein [Metabacillus idriensis]|uniref:hypothetical protein n=1 Tax=Metabacillus idriensis TaxID=324768 RepID=UPI003D2877D8